MLLNDVHCSETTDHIINVKQISELEIEIDTPNGQENYIYDDIELVKEDLKRLNKAKSRILFS